MYIHLHPNSIPTRQELTASPTLSLLKTFFETESRQNWTMNAKASIAQCSFDQVINSQTQALRCAESKLDASLDDRLSPFALVKRQRAKSTHRRAPSATCRRREHLSRVTGSFTRNSRHLSTFCLIGTKYVEALCSSHLKVSLLVATCRPRPHKDAEPKPLSLQHTIL